MKKVGFRLRQVGFPIQKHIQILFTNKAYFLIRFVSCFPAYYLFKDNPRLTKPVNYHDLLVNACII